MQASWTYALCLALVTLPAAARPAFYWTATEASHLAMDYIAVQDSDFEDASHGEVSGKRYSLNAQYESGHTWLLGLGYEYDSLEFATAAAHSPQANGDFHTLNLTFQWRAALADGELRLAVAPAVSSSSNMLQHLGEFDSDSMQLWGAAIYTVPTTAFNWIIGLAADHRFGDQRAYPVAGLQWQAADTLVRVAYPDLLLRQGIGEHWRIELRAGPDGNLWLAYDDQLQERHDFRSKAWQGELRLGFSPVNSLELGLSLGYRWNQQWRYTTIVGDTTRLNSEDAAYLGVHLRWQFKRQAANRETMGNS